MKHAHVDCINLKLSRSLCRSLDVWDTRQ